jgi:hypothetical protein
MDQRTWDIQLPPLAVAGTAVPADIRDASARWTTENNEAVEKQ